jgi:2-oxoglutarate ferredoxin oxidoreductase subunit alpha
MNNRSVIKVGGESGQGVNSIGEMLAKALKRMGYKIFGYREYPSLIKGGFTHFQVASYQIDFSDKTLRSSSNKFDLAVCVSRLAIPKFLKDMNPGGILIHSIPKVKLSDIDLDLMNKNNIHIEYVDAKAKVKELGGKSIMENTFLVALAWKFMGLTYEVIEEAFKIQFAKKPEILEINLRCLKAGYEYVLGENTNKLEINYNKDENWHDSAIISGNEIMGMGIIEAGVRAYFAYPMTPSSSILSFLADNYHHSKMLVKQAEDEITAAQMAIGAMHMGTRALTGTSGGGFDLMTETVSLAAITETPFVCILAQRPGPATGLPTWTCAADLNLAVFSAHGEFTRCVIAASDPDSAFLSIQEAFNIAERYQIPVIVLTEKQIGESLFNFKNLPKPIEIHRDLIPDELIGNIKSSDRYKLTESGISPRWLPGQTIETFTANSDEHFENGRLTEDGEESRLMMEKRMAKEKFLQKELPDPKLFGEEEGEILFVGWGSPKNTVLDAIDISKDRKISYLHFEYVWPLRTQKLANLKNNFKKIVLIENNYMGQLGNLIRMVSGIEFNEKLLKYDGRGFFLEEILEFINKI